MAQYTIAPLQIDITASKASRVAAVRDLVSQVVSVTDPASANLAMLFRYLIWHESAQATARVQQSGIARGLIQIQPNRLADTARRFLLGADALDIAASLAFSAPTVTADMTDALIQFQTETRAWPNSDTRLADWLSGAPPSARLASDTFAVLLMRYDFRANFSAGDPNLSDANACANVWADWWWRGNPADRPARLAAFLDDAADYDASLNAFSSSSLVKPHSTEIVNRTRRRDLYRGDVVALPPQPIYDGDCIFTGVVSAQNLGWVYSFLGDLLIKKIDDTARGYLILTLQSQQNTELAPADTVGSQELLPSGPTVLYFAAPDDVKWHMDCTFQAIASAIGAWDVDPLSQIAFPYGLILSPRRALQTSVPQPFGDALTRFSQRLDRVMWHMKLRGTPLKLQPKTDLSAYPPSFDPSVTPGLSKEDIKQIVDSHIDVVAGRMIFSSLGASADVSWNRLVPSPTDNLDGYGETDEGGRQSTWLHAEHLVPFPTRHWMSQTYIWKRQPASSVGRLVRHEYIRLNQPTISVEGAAARRLGGKSITLQAPSGAALSEEIYPQLNPNWTVRYADGSPVQYAGSDLQVYRFYLLAGNDPVTNQPIQGPEVTWHATFTDLAATPNPMPSSPLAFFYIKPDVASAMDKDPALLRAVSDAYVRDILSPGTGFPVNFNRPSAVIADFQDPRNSGVDRVTADKVTYELINMVMHAELNTSVSGLSSWLPAARTITVTSPAIRAFLGSPSLANGGVTINFDPKYVTDGIYDSFNAAGVFGQVQTAITTALAKEQTCVAALNGSLQQLSASANAMSGLIAGKFTMPMEGQLQTLDWSALAPAKVLNLFSLADLQKLFPNDVLAVPAYTIIPLKNLERGELPGVLFSLTKADVPLAPIKLDGLTVAKIASPTLAIKGTIRNFAGKIPERTVDIRFPAVTVPIPPPETPLTGTIVTLTFGRNDTGIHVTWHPDGKIDLDAPLTHVEFNSGLINTLSDLAKTIESQQNPLINFVTDPHTALPAILVQLSIHLPAIGLGVFGLCNLALNTRLYYPLADRKPSVEIDIADALKQFELSVCMLSGFGFFGMRITGFDASDIDFYGSLDFGASMEISLLGIAKGGVSVHAGFYYESGTSELSLNAHLQISGNLSVLFFSVDAYFYLGIGYSNGVYAGEAIFHVEFHALFLSISLDLRCRREFAGIAKSSLTALAADRASYTPAPVITADAYRRYCAAFA